MAESNPLVEPLKAARERPGLSLRARALQHLARREHSRQELARKLADHAPDEAVLACLLDDLQARGWLSDVRAAESLVRRLAPKQGGRRVQHALQRLGVSVDVQSEALLAVRETEMDRAQALWGRKYAHAPADAKERARQMRFLLARGFAPEVVGKVVPRVRPGGGPSEADETQDQSPNIRRRF